MEMRKPFTTNERVILVLFYGLAVAEIVFMAWQRYLPTILIPTVFVLAFWLREQPSNPRWQRWSTPPAIVIVVVATVQLFLRLLR